MAVGLETMEHEGTAGAGFAGAGRTWVKVTARQAINLSPAFAPALAGEQGLAPPGRSSQNRSKAVAWPLLYTTCPVR